MPTTCSSAKKVYKQPAKKAANKAKYQENENINTIVSVIGHPTEDRSNTTAGSVKVPRELLSSLSLFTSGHHCFTFSLILSDVRRTMSKVKEIKGL